MNRRHAFLIGNYSPDAQWSMRQIAEIVQAAAEAGGWKVTCLVPRERFGRGRNTQGGLGKYLGYLDKYVLAPAQFRRELRAASARGEAPALIHIVDHSNAIYNATFGSMPVLVTCHDLIAIRRALGEFPGRPGWLGRRQQHWILNALRRARHVVFDSDASRQDFLRLTGSRLQTAEVIFPCLAQPLRPVARTEALDQIRRSGISVRGPFLFHHGNSSWYKNREQVLDVFLDVRRQHPDLELVCSGGKLTPEQSAVVREAGAVEAVHDAGNVSIEVLQALYSSAAVFLFPSWAEGFGWPPVEAQVCGCPVVASNAGSLAEVLGDSALVAAPANKAAFVAHVNAVLDDPRRAENLRARGFENIRRFGREEMAAKYVDAYERIGLGQLSAPTDARACVTATA